MDNKIDVTYEEILEQMRNRIGMLTQSDSMKDAFIKKMMDSHEAVLKEKNLEIGEREKEVDDMRELVKHLKEKIAELEKDNNLKNNK